MFLTIFLTNAVCLYFYCYKANLGALPVNIYPIKGNDDPNKLFYIDF